MDVNETEMRATEIVYEKEHGEKVSFSDISEEERTQILKRIRARVMRIEQFVTHDMLEHKMSEGRRTPRRYMIVSFTLIGIIIAIIIVVEGVLQLFGSH